MQLKDTIKVGAQTAQLSRSQWWSSSKIEQYQNTKLVSVLRYAVKNIPYYASLNINPETICSIEDLQRFPILKKSMVQELEDDLISNTFLKKNLYQSRTSGTTGEPTTTFFDENCWLMSKYSLKIRRMVAKKVSLFKHVVIISELSAEEIRNSQPLPFSQHFFKKTLLSIHDTIQEHLTYLNNENIDAIYGFPSYFEELIQYCESNDIKLPSIPVVFTSSEVLRCMLRERIKKYFNAEVCDIYGCTEFKEVAWQCESGKYHLNFESVWAESYKKLTLNNSGMGKLLLTSLYNKAMPLIRYQVGDLAELSKTPCDCGRNSWSLESISGREIDMLLLPDGKKISPYLLTTVIEKNNIISMYQIVQVARDCLEVTYVPRKKTFDGADNFDSTVLQLKKYTGSNMSIYFHEVKNIDRNVSGKRQIFIRSLEMS